MIEELVVFYTNEERQALGLAPLIHDETISDIARAHSQNGATQDYFEHEMDGKNPTDRALDAGYDCRYSRGDGTRSFGFSENIATHPRVREWVGARGKPDSWEPTIYSPDEDAAAKRLVDRWMASPGHRKNIVNEESRRIGVGIVITTSPKHGYHHEIIWATQNFSPCVKP